MSIDIVKLSWGGSVSIKNTNFLSTSFDATCQVNIPKVSYVYTSTSSNTYDVRHQDGTKIWNWNCSFDSTAESLSVIKGMVTGGLETIPISWNDGNTGGSFSKAYVTSISLSSSANQIITGIVSGVAIDDIGTNIPSGYVRDRDLMGYWASGNTDVQGWTFNWSREATPMWLNTPSMFPLYVKTGKVSASLEVNCYRNLQTHNSVSIFGGGGFTLSGQTTSYGVNISGNESLPMWKHTLEVMRGLGQDNTGSLIT